MNSVQIRSWFHVKEYPDDSKDIVEKITKFFPWIKEILGALIFKMPKIWSP